jgi:hypothetical protein
LQHSVSLNLHVKNCATCRLDLPEDRLDSFIRQTQHNKIVCWGKSVALQHRCFVPGQNEVINKSTVRQIAFKRNVSVSGEFGH